jgi:ATP-dependent Lon protease
MNESPDISLYKYKIFSLKNEYNELSNLLCLLQYHLILQFNKSIISPKTKENCIIKIQDIIKKINIEYKNCVNDNTNSHINVYNNSTSMLKSILNNETEDKLFNSIQKTILMAKYINILPNSTFDKLLFSTNITSPLYDVKKLILNVCRDIGFPSIDIGLKLIIDYNYDKCIDKDLLELLKFYNQFFIPIGYYIDDAQNFDDNIVIKLADENKDVLLNRLVKLYIKNINNDGKINYIVMIGYIKNDNNNFYIKTAQIGNRNLYNKKRKFDNIIQSKNRTYKDINEINFKKAYVKNITLHEYILYSETEMSTRLSEMYNFYKKIKDKDLQNLETFFIENTNITKMYKTIKVLLLGNKKDMVNAGLLFKLIRNKKSKSVYLSDIIYDCLPINLKTELKHSKKNINDELEKIKKLSLNTVDYEERITFSEYIPKKVKKLAMEKIEEMKLNNNEYHKQLLYVKTILNFPWPNKNKSLFSTLKISEDRIEFLDNITTKLTNLSHGHEKPKKILKQLIGKWITNPESSGNVLAFSGPPGVGKTRLARNVSSALGLPFVQITLGGQNDGELLHGHGYTYSSAQPGLIIKKMVEAGNEKCVLYFDELDKACSKNGKTNEIMSILIHLTDEDTSKTFQDRFFQGVDFPVDKAIIIFSYNDGSLVDPILRDRFDEIDFKPYTTRDKVEIVKNFLLAELCESINFDKYNIIINDKNIEYIIDNYTYEAGVRDIKRKIRSILLELNIDRIYKRGLFESKKSLFKQDIKISRNYITKILGSTRIETENISKISKIGIINGLYATKSGLGGILPVEFSKNFAHNDNKCEFILTGSVGKVMTESVRCAYTAARKFIDDNYDKFKDVFSEDNIDDLIVNKFPYGFHIHAPKCSTPKEGPSAGCAFSIGFISLITGLKIKNTIAMTGEIDSHGNVTKIGGLQYKLIGAKKAGVRNVFIPLENKDDIEEIIKNNTNLFTNNFQMKYINHLDDVVYEVLII